MPIGSGPSVYRSEREGARRLAIVGMAIAAAILVVAVWALFFRGQGAGGRTTPEFSFSIGGVRTIAPEGSANPQRAARAVGETLDALYVAGFVDPSKWEDGTFTEALRTFAPDAARRARRDLDDLTLGRTAPEVAFVEPAAGFLRITFLVDHDRSPVAAVGRVRFEATGELHDGRRLAITHRGRYLLRPVEDRWLIAGYQVEGGLQPVSTPSEGEGSP